MGSGDTWLPSVQNNLVRLQKDLVNRPCVCEFCLKAIAKGVLERSFTMSTAPLYVTFVLEQLQKEYL